MKVKTETTINMESKDIAEVVKDWVMSGKCKDVDSKGLRKEDITVNVKVERVVDSEGGYDFIPKCDITIRLS